MLHEPSKPRLQGGTTGPQLLELFERLVIDAREMDCPCLDLVITYIEEDDKFVEGTFVPDLHLIMRKVYD